MQLALSRNSADGKTLQERIYSELRAMILDGRLRPKERLPGSRALAADLGVSRTTVVLALERLIAEGYLESRPRVGAFVAATLPEEGLRVRAPLTGTARTTSATRSPISAPRLLSVVRQDRPRPELDFAVGRPDPDLFPLRAWYSAVEAELSALRRALSEYGDPQGEPVLREAIAAHIGASRGIRAEAADVVVVAGSQDGIMLVCRMFTGYARVFLHEDPCYRGAFDVFSRCGMRCIAVPTDDFGLVPERLPGCRRGLLYVTPSHQYPLGVTLPPERRQAVLAWADRTDSFILEDDYDGDFCYEQAPLPALAAMDESNRVLYLATFSKCLGPGLRLGYLVVPPSLRAAAVAWKALSSIGVPCLEQAAMGRFMTSGAFERHLRRIRQVYRARRDRLLLCLEKAFGPQHISGQRGGMHIAWRLPPNWPCAETLACRAYERGVGLYSLRTAGAWASRNHPRLRDTLLLGYAALSELQIDAAVERIAATVHTHHALARLMTA